MDELRAYLYMRLSHARISPNGTKREIAMTTEYPIRMGTNGVPVFGVLVVVTRGKRPSAAIPGI